MARISVDTSLSLLNCLRSKITLKQGKVFEFFETDSWTHGLGKLEKIMQKVLEIHGIWRAQKSANPVIYNLWYAWDILIEIEIAGGRMWFWNNW